MAIGLISALNDCGIRVPLRMSVAGFVTDTVAIGRILELC